MEFRNTYFQKNVESLQNKDISSEEPAVERFDLEFDFVEQYRDIDGVLHIKTSFNHDDLDECDLWEVFDSAEGSFSLEI